MPTEISYEPYDSFYTGEEIDERLGRVDKFSNRNLIDNPWFTVNQRGQTNYTSNGYTVDRWKMAAGIASVAVSDNGIAITKATSGSPDFFQQLDEQIVKFIIGKPITLSVMMQNGVVYSASIVLPDAITSWQIPIAVQTPYGTIRYQHIKTAANVYTGIVDLYHDVGNSDIRAVKLEIGSISTLANDSLPNYAEELAKCQRYFFRAFGNNGYFMRATNPAQGYAGIAFPVPMRAIPSASGSVVVWPGNVTTNNITVLSGSGAATDVKGCMIGLSELNGLTAGALYTIQSGTDIAFSADL